jgi:hypothetical protein
MSDFDSILKQADHLLEENNFAAALELYRAATRAGPPTRYLLDNLRVAEEQEALEFSRTLRQKYPDSLVAGKNHVYNLLQLGGHWTAHAVILCTELLEQLDLDVTEERSIRRLRFHAATRTGFYAMRDPYRTLVEDFSKILQAGDTYHFAIRSRGAMLVDLARMEATEAIPLLRELGGLEWLPLAAKQFLDTKIMELQILEEVIQEFKIRNGDT